MNTENREEQERKEKKEKTGTEMERRTRQAITTIIVIQGNTAGPILTRLHGTGIESCTERPDICVFDCVETAGHEGQTARSVRGRRRGGGGGEVRSERRRRGRIETDDMG
jgi:hypothetical protein